MMNDYRSIVTLDKSNSLTQQWLTGDQSSALFSRDRHYMHCTTVVNR